VVRAKAVAADMLDSYISARTYVFGETTNLRLVAVSGDWAALNGNNGVLNTGAKDDVTVSCEIYDYDGALMASQVCGLRMSGHSSRMRFAQKALMLRAKRIYGTADFDCALFTGRDADAYDSFVLRASGQDVFQTHMRDSILTSLAAGTGLYYQETELCVLYVNGVYWGVYNMREHVNLESLARFEGVNSTDGIDFLEGDVTKYTLAGSRKTYDQIMDKVEDVGLQSEDVVAELAKYVDIDNYLTYVAVQMYTANLDLNNLRAYRVSGGTWKWVLYDLDLSFQVDKNTPAMWLDDEPAGTITIQDNTLFREMMKNDGLRDRFLTIMGDLLATNFSAQNVAEKIYARYETLAPDMAAQCARWGTSVSTWNRYVKYMLRYAETRPEKLIGYLTSAFSLTGDESARYFADALAAADAYVRPTLGEDRE
jgi:spore coat protein CotH